MIGEYVRLDRAAEHALSEALAETDSLDPGWRVDELEAKRRVVPDEENSALQILKATGVIPHNWWKDEHELLFENLPPERQLSAKQIDALRKGLEPVGAALVEARRLADMPHGRFPTPVGDGRYRPYPYRQDAALIGRLLGHDVDVRVQEGDSDGALVSCRALLNTGRAIGDEPQLWSQLLRIGLQRDAVLKMERSLAQGEPTEASLEALQRLLADDDQHPAILIALRGERASADVVLESLQKGSNLPMGSIQVQRGVAAVAPLPHDEELSMIASGSLKGQRAALLRVYNDFVEAGKLPPDQRRTRLQQVMARPRGFNPPTILRALMDPAWVQVQSSRLHALVPSAVVALAAERYRRQHGRWPDTLDALVPAFLRDVPVDPQDGTPLRYRRLIDGVVIYSIGPDMVDNGGKLDRQNRIAAGVDIGVQLWDPNRRRQPPAPAAQ